MTTIAVPPLHAPTPPAADSRTTVLLASTAVFLIALELTIISVALPHIETAFPDAGRSTLSWIFTGYNVGVASLLLVAGWLAERVGRKRIFQAGMVVFTAGSILSGLAPSVAVLIAARVIQAIGGAMLIPASLALILHAVAPDRRDAAVGVWGAMAGLAAAVGPSLGGVLVQYAGWRWVFLVNVPIAIVALVLGRTHLTESRDPTIARTVDMAAVPSGALGVGALVFAITAGGPLGWSDPRILAAVAVAIALLGVLLIRSATHPRPVFDPAIAHEPSFAVGAMGTLFFGAAFAGWLVLAPTFFAEVWGYSGLRSGLAIAPAPLAMAVTAKPAGRLTARVGHCTMIAIGSLIPLAGVAWWSLFISASPAWTTAFLPGAVAFGVGVGICFPMLTAASLRDVPPHQYAMGAAGNTTLRQVAIAIGIAAAIAIVGSDDVGGADVDRFHHSWWVCGALFLATSIVMALAYPTTPALRVGPQLTDLTPIDRQTKDLHS